MERRTAGQAGRSRKQETGEQREPGDQRSAEQQQQGGQQRQEKETREQHGKAEEWKQGQERAAGRAPRSRQRETEVERSAEWREKERWEEERQRATGQRGKEGQSAELQRATQREKEERAAEQQRGKEEQRSAEQQRGKEERAAGRVAHRRHHGNRHGRSEDARQAVLRAADDLLAEKGFAGVTIEGIAAAAGVAKQTVYRWWSSKTDVLLDAFLEDAAEELTPADLGGLERDLRAHLRHLARFLVKADAGAVFRALIGHAQHDPTFAATLRAHYLDEQRRRDRLPLERAIARGELPAGFDTAAAVDQLVGPVYHRVLVTGDPVTSAFVDGIVSGFLEQHGQGLGQETPGS